MGSCLTIINLVNLWTFDMRFDMRSLLLTMTFVAHYPLSNRGWQGPSICALCCENKEKLEHLLFDCTFTVNLWTNLLQGNPITKHILLNQVGDLQSRWHRVRNSHSGQEKALFNLRFAAICWELWKEINSRIFENRKSGSGEVCNKVLSSVVLWLSFLRG